MRNPRFWQKALVTWLIVVLAIGPMTTDAEAKSRKQTTSRQIKKRRTSPVTQQNLYADIVIEAQTGRILHATNATSLRHPASLTKMMTLYLVFQALENGSLRPGQSLPVSSHAAAQSPSKLGLRPGQTIKVQDAIMGVVTKSANDAAVVLAEAVGESEDGFAKMMTRQAHNLGMKQTVFKNASGLPDPDQVSSARDMAILGHALVYHYPRFYNVFSSETFTYAGQVHNNHNHLMKRYDGMDGIKTGYVRASGFNLVASAVRDGRRLIGVVFGGRSTLSRDNQMVQLLDQGFAREPAEKQASYAERRTEDQGDSLDIADNRYLALPSKITVAYKAPQPETNEPSSGGEQDAMAAIAPTAPKWGIQIGAYHDAASGQRVLEKMTKDMTPLLNRADPILQKIVTDEGTAIYRARFMGMEQAIARSICSYIVKHGQGCLVVAPEQSGSL